MQLGTIRIVLCTLILMGLPCTIWGSKKKKKPEEEPKTQVLPLPKELPMALLANPQTLQFHVSGLLREGHLSVQIRESLNRLIRDERGETIVKLRAFVAGAGDARRVQDVVSDLFTDKKLPLPVLTIIQVGALGNDASQVVFESITSGRDGINPSGLAFFAGEKGPSLTAAIAKLTGNMQAAAVTPVNVVSATCFASFLSDYAAMREKLTSAFPQAAANLVQAVRDPVDSSVTCEAIGRLSSANAPDKLTHITQSRVAFVNGDKIVFTGLQLSFGTFLDDATSALSRLQRTVQTLHAEVKDTAALNAFSLSPAAESALRKTMIHFDVPPSALTIQAVEGLPSLDATLGMEAVLVPEASAPGTAMAGKDHFAALAR